MAPHDTYRCAGPDSWVSICVGSDAEWQALCQAMGIPELAVDERFGDQLSRWDNQDLLRPIIESWTRDRTHYEVMEILQRAGVAAVPSFTMAELVADPHVGQRGINVEVRHPNLGSLVAPGAPWRLSGIPEVPYRAGPLMGEHNGYVLGELLGLSRQEITDLVEQEVIY